MIDMTNTTDEKNNKGVPTITLDYALYESYLNDSDLSDEQKIEFIDTLWNIIVSFVDLGFGVHPSQQAQESANKKITDSHGLENLLSHIGKTKSVFNQEEVLTSQTTQNGGNP